MADGPRIVRADPIPDNILDILRMEGIAGDGVADYPNRLRQQFANLGMTKTIGELALFVEPEDRDLAIDTALPAANTFATGAMIGLRVVAACVDDVDKALMDMIKIPIPDISDEADDKHRNHLIGESILAAGHQGYDGVRRTFEPLFDEWEDRITPEIPLQSYLHSGFGLPIYFLAARYEENAFLDHVARKKQLEQEAEKEIESFDPNAIDWGA